MLKPQPFLGFPRKRQGRARWTVWEGLVPITSVGSGLWGHFQLPNTWPWGD